MPIETWEMVSATINDVEEQDNSEAFGFTGLPRMRTKYGLAQTISDSTLTALQWDKDTSSGDTDTEGFFSAPGPRAVRVPFVGQYLHTVHVPWDAGSNAGFRQIVLKTSVNGGLTYFSTSLNDLQRAAPTGNNQNFSGVVNVPDLGSTSDGRRWRIEVQHTDGGDLDVVTTPVWTIVYLGPQ